MYFMMQALKWLMNNKNIALGVLLFAFLSGTHYYVYNKGKQTERLKTLESDNAALIEMAKEFASIKDHYDGLMLDLPKSSLNTGPAVTIGIDRLPKPKNKPR
jgi:hypothetical protein